MSDQPLIHTSKGNLPVASLTYATKWDFGPTWVKFTEQYTDADGDVVRESCHVFDTQGVAGSGALA